jgi:hypothetical protein
VTVLAFTLDHNCVIDIEESRHATPCVRALLARHEAGEIVVRLVAASASELQRDGRYLENALMFRGRLASLGPGHLPLLLPTLTLDVSYLDLSVLASQEDVSQQMSIHHALFPNEAFVPQEAWDNAAPGADLEAIRRKWQNRAVDVQTLWCHIHYGGDVFVTSDRVFSSRLGGNR